MKKLFIIAVFIVMVAGILGCSGGTVYPYFQKDSQLYLYYNYHKSDRYASVYINDEFITSMPSKTYIIIHLDEGNYTVSLKVGGTEKSRTVYIGRRDRTYLSVNWTKDDSLKFVDKVSGKLYGDDYVYDYEEENVLDSEEEIEIQADLIFLNDRNETISVSFKKVVNYDLGELPDFLFYIDEDDFEGLFTLNIKKYKLEIYNIDLAKESYPDKFILENKNSNVKVSKSKNRDNEDAISFTFILTGDYKDTNLLIKESSYIILRSVIF